MKLSRPLAITAAWLGVALVAAAEVSIRAYVLGYAPVGRAIAGELAIIPLWALVTPLVFAATARWRVTWRTAPLYLVAGLAFTVLANAIIHLPVDGGYARRVVVALTIYAPGAMLAWSAIVGIGVRLAPRAQSAAEGTTHLILPDGAKTLRVSVETIEWIEAEDNYVLIHTPQKTHTVRQRMRDLESQLDAARFARVHRSAIVSVARVAAVRPLTHGDFEVVLESGAVVRGTRSRRSALRL
jgi:hypothetical protein